MAQQLGCRPVQQLEISDFDFDMTRTFSVLLAVLVIPINLALMSLLFSISIVT